MDIIKKNITSIICGLVAILAIVAAFYPTGDYFDSLQQTVQARKAKYDAVQKLTIKKRFLPTVGLKEAAPETLKPFPNRDIIAAAKTAQDQIKNEAAKVVESAVRLNELNHPLLTPNSLPTPGQSEPFIFQQQLEKEYVRLRTDVLHGCQPPTAEVITKAGADLTESQVARYIKLPDGKIANQPDIDAETATLLAALPEKLRREQAHAFKIYLDKDVLQVPVWVKNERPKPAQIWYAQHILWVERDVCQAIAAMNAGDMVNANITNDPVKHLLKLEVLQEGSNGDDRMHGGMEPGMMAPGGFRQPGGQPGGMAPAPAGGAAAAAGPDILAAALPQAPDSPTLRATNGFYEVVTFHLIVCVDANKIEPFLQKLEEGRFICVRNVNEMKRVDPSSHPAIAGQGGFAPTGEGFVYGSQPVAELDLTCEELFLRDWTSKWMPDTVKQALKDSLGLH